MNPLLGDGEADGDPAERQAFGRAGREIAGQFAQESVIAATLDVYHELIADTMIAPLRRDGRRCDSPSTRPNG